MKFPDLPQKGKRVEDTIRQILDYIRASRITGVSGGTLRQSSNGTTIQIGKTRPSQNISAAASPPFQLISGKDEDGDPVLYVRHGAFTVEKWFTAASGSTLDCNALELAVTVNAGPLVSAANPIGSLSPPGALALDVSTDYGAWIVAETSLVSKTAFTDGSVPKAMAFSDPIVIISETALAASDANSLTTTGTYEGFAAWFLGSVSVDGDGVVSLEQYRRSDITVVEPVWIHPVIVSADVPNSITAGSDGGALYEEP